MDEQRPASLGIDPPGADAGFDAMCDELRERLADPDWSVWTEVEFARRALQTFALQYEACAPYRAFCDRRGDTPAIVGSWHDVPAVPATAFKFFDFAVRGAQGGAVFRTSGTTRGAERRGRHHVPRLDLYRASLAEPFRRALLHDLGDDPVFASLVPSPAELPDSSLAFMIGAAADRFAAETVWLVGASGEWRADALARLGALSAGGERPVLLLGTALSFLRSIERASVDPDGPEAGALRGLPEGSRVMETGGFKGVAREVSRTELYDGITALTGVPRGRIVNEYGMTELLSQLYEPVLREGPEGEGVLEAPPWLRVRALDPDSLEPVPAGEEGILAFFDLANLGSIAHVLTEDLGSVEPVPGDRVPDTTSAGAAPRSRVRLRGRRPGSEPRGCSRAMDDLMGAARG